LRFIKSDLVFGDHGRHIADGTDVGHRFPECQEAAGRLDEPAESAAVEPKQDDEGADQFAPPLALLAGHLLVEKRAKLCGRRLIGSGIGDRNRAGCEGRRWFRCENGFAAGALASGVGAGTPAPAWLWIPSGEL
jgi:hypothetical protein